MGTAESGTVSAQILPNSFPQWVLPLVMPAGPWPLAGTGSLMVELRNMLWVLSYFTLSSLPTTIREAESHHSSLIESHAMETLWLRTSLSNAIKNLSQQRISA